MAVDCFESVEVLRQPPDNLWSSELRTVGPRTHQRLYQRQHSGLQENSPTVFALPATPMNSSTSSPSNNPDPFACWSPIPVEEKPANTWSNVYNWMHSASDNSSAGDECNESTNSGSDNFVSRPTTWTSVESSGVFTDVPPSTHQFNQPSTARLNDENVLTQMLRLSLAESQNQHPSFNSHFVPENGGGLLMRKWSNESDSSENSNFGRPIQPPQRSEVRNHRQFYAPYVNSDESKRWTSSVENYGGLPSSSTPHYIPANSEKWSTARERVGPTEVEVRQLIAKHFRELLAEQQQLGYPPAHRPQTQLDPRLQGSSRDYRRQVFAPLNNPTSSPVHRRAVCDEAELQWYHHNLELQQSVYDRIYNMVLSGQLKAQQNGRVGFVETSTASRGFPSPSTLVPSPPLDLCSAQYRQLEKERKKTEAELAKHNLGKKISSSNTLPIPRLPPAPSRIDRLVVDFFREHARVITLLCRMEQLRSFVFDPRIHQTMREWLDSIRLLQQRRLSERNAILGHLHGDGAYDEERESAQLNDALTSVTKAAIRARAANWCALVQTLGVEDHVQQLQWQRIFELDFNCEPPEIRVRPMNV